MKGKTPARLTLRGASLLRSSVYEGSFVSASKDRLRPPPAERFAGAEHRIDLASSLEALRREAHDNANKHRQITVFHKGPLRIVLFAFEAGGGLPSHRAPGAVVIHTLRGRIQVTTLNESHDLATGQMLLLDPEVVHDVKAWEESDMLLTVTVS
jgi:quercetin dioxygenase-like cupin family protein